MVKSTSELSGNISKNLQCTWEMKACPECVPEALALLIFETESDNSQRRMREVSSSNERIISPGEMGNLSNVNRQFYCKEMLGLSSFSC